ncbi:MAG: hypothetical protein WBO55_09690 [Rhizobiaceae bacterium]
MMRPLIRLARLFALLAGMFSACPVLAGEQFIGADPSGQIVFQTPSGNIGCIYTPQGGTDVYMPADGGPELACDRREPAYLRFILSREGPATLVSDPHDVGCCSGEVLQYGNYWQVGEFTCDSSRSGLACARGVGGFFISRAKVDVF